MVSQSFSGVLITLSTLSRILAGVPLAALFVLFDLIVDNPTHPETTATPALLDVGTGHFSGLEYASQGTLPGSIISEFTQIARAYVWEKSVLGMDAVPRLITSSINGGSLNAQMCDSALAEGPPIYSIPWPNVIGISRQHR